MAQRGDKTEVALPCEQRRTPTPRPNSARLGRGSFFFETDMSISAQQLGDLYEKTGQPRIGRRSPVPALLAGGECVAQPSKYKAVRSVDAEGLKWDSKAERARYGVLKLLERNGTIECLERQPRFDLLICNLAKTGVTKNLGFYKADFRYRRDGRVVVEDVKGVRTSVFILKKRLVEHLYGITITEIR